jgi:FixJ family two-component response regulator
LPRVPSISIIDDNASVRIATDRLVRSLGYVARTFASAHGFLQSPHVNDTACVIADVQMPGMSGIELQSRLIGEGRCVPMIFITAFPEERIRSRALKAGAVGFLSKPFDGTLLIECIDIALKRHELAPMTDPGCGRSR